MKKFLFLMMVTALSVSVNAQSEKYISAMKTNISLTDSSFTNPDNFLSLANTFERIGAAEKTQWLPYYYAAYCRVNFAFMQQDRSGNDAIADKAEEMINKADSLQPKNSEISCVKSMIASVRLMVNPQQRYMQYGSLSSGFLTAAKEQDPTNPRPYMLKGQGLQFTPEQFGGGCKTAKPELEMAVEKFNTFKPASEISPNWGKTYTEGLLKACP